MRGLRLKFLTEPKPENSRTVACPELQRLREAAGMDPAALVARVNRHLRKDAAFVRNTEADAQGKDSKLLGRVSLNGDELTVEKLASYEDGTAAMPMIYLGALAHILVASTSEILGAKASSKMPWSLE